ncbi:aldo/keto reductase [Nonomuraea fuscirosea]|uniref:aldo/keto reductase n=1 Tax=Nonomuraea fuscirosea TaxID=1291556 RepID=UPI0033E88997
MSVALPRLGLGTAPIGNLFAEVSERDAAATVAAAAAVGMTYFDTAPRYGHGVAEDRLGRALADSSADGTAHGAAGRAADGAVISTKAGWLLRPGERVVTDWTERGLRESLESSLGRLRRPAVDVLFLHDPDDFGEEIRRTGYPAARRIRGEGLAGAIGFGMNHCEPLAAYVAEFEPDVVLIAGRFSLLDHDALTTLLPLCAKTGTTVVVGGVFNTGLLADPRPGAMFHYRETPPDVLARARRCGEICAEFGVPLAAAAVRFPYLHPAVGSVVVGCRSAEEVRANAAAARTEIPPELWHRLAAEGFVPPELLEA